MLRVNARPTPGQRKGNTNFLNQLRSAYLTERPQNSLDCYDHHETSKAPLLSLLPSDLTNAPSVSEAYCSCHGPDEVESVTHLNARLMPSSLSFSLTTMPSAKVLIARLAILRCCSCHPANSAATVC